MLQPHEGPIAGTHYLPSTPETCLWGRLPTRRHEPVLRIRSGETVTIDTLSHEGILEDQGRDPVAYLKQFDVPADGVLADARDLAASDVAHDYDADGPHVVTGPIAVDGAEPGDVLRVEVLDLLVRAPYGFVSSRHGYGALPGEFPLTPADTGAGGDVPRAYGSVCHFTAVVSSGGRLYGTLPYGDGRAARFPLAPFLGLMGVAVDTDDPVHSVPPGAFGGNLDINELQIGSALYLPVQLPGAGFYAGDPHYAQGDGEVALTALEAPLRATLRLSVVPQAQAGALGVADGPFAETATHWLPVGLHSDLDEAMRRAVRAAVAFLARTQGMPPQTALAYLSAAADFEVSQVVDGVKGIHCLIRKADFPVHV
ncbi:acetamidase/formamidase family protein [Micromonospora carbonacea]|uniref:Acetamidase/formamidase family protein n=1 Tax=Micromonospora carbonacea TaxID=47853 RepID=A0A7H8XN07_9ACTN|nr:acetamidase/formamidase family protein [Micromonospora carbonacea]MBB5827183.1 acetamidase/formamidase [Micromonospora carbonacea]QLD25021.1 acetamidase/formamidase family protein [Micromonospora carbonacea]